MHFALKFKPAYFSLLNKVFLGTCKQSRPQSTKFLKQPYSFQERKMLQQY